jgi:hypothetical protein
MTRIPVNPELLAWARERAGLDALALAKSFRERYLKPALADGLIEMSIPDKPNSRLQRYRLTDQGRAVVAEQQGN